MPIGAETIIISTRRDRSSHANADRREPETTETTERRLAPVSTLFYRLRESRRGRPRRGSAHTATRGSAHMSLSAPGGARGARAQARVPAPRDVAGGVRRAAFARARDLPAAARTAAPLGARRVVLPALRRRRARRAQVRRRGPVRAPGGGQVAHEGRGDLLYPADLDDDDDASFAFDVEDDDDDARRSRGSSSPRARSPAP